MNVPLTLNIKLNIISLLNDEARPVLTVSGDITTHVGYITNFSPVLQWIADGCNRHLERLESKMDGVYGRIIEKRQVDRSVRDCRPLTGMAQASPPPPCRL
jgi:hypothetical protein